MVREDSEEVALEQRGRGSEEVSHVDIWRKSVPGRGNSKCKFPGTWKKSKASVGGTE